MVYFVNILEDMAGMVSMNTHLKGVLVFSGVFDIVFCGLFRYDNMFRKGQDLPLDKFLYKNLQYLQPLVTLWTCVLISDAIILEKVSFGVFAFMILTFILFLPKVHVSSARYVVISTRSVNWNQRKPYKTFSEKCRYIPNSLTK